jgi:hypothetical protein
MMFVAERRISSWVMTVMAAADSPTVLSVRVTVETSISISCSCPKGARRGGSDVDDVSSAKADIPLSRRNTDKGNHTIFFMRCGCHIPIVFLPGRTLLYSFGCRSENSRSNYTKAKM